MATKLNLKPESSSQPERVSELVYSGYKPHAYSWDEFPPLKEILDAVHKAIPGSHFNSLLLNRYKGGNDYVGWHADDEKLYGPTPEIASVSFGCERDFFLKKKPNKTSRGKNAEGEPPSKRSKTHNNSEQHHFALKHGSLLLMRGYTQRDWLHSVPKRAKVEAVRINLTFRADRPKHDLLLKADMAHLLRCVAPLEFGIQI
nr:DNA oxidative demethylase ALKBH2 isoform X2 [Ipomoea trifida]